MFAGIFIERNALKFDPGVSFEARGMFAGSEAQLGGKAATIEQETEGHALLETIGAEEKMASGGGS